MKEELEKKIEYSTIDGTISKEYYINQKRQYHGSYKSFWFNQKLSYQYEYKNNQRNGLTKSNWYTGSIGFINTQKNGEIFGLIIEFK